MLIEKQKEEEEEQLKQTKLKEQQEALKQLRKKDKPALTREQLAEYQRQMQVVEGGCYLKDGKDSTQKTCVKTFKIDTHEVTQAEYKTVMGENPSYFSDCGNDCPVEQVNWFSAKEYCNKIAKLKVKILKPQTNSAC